MSRNAVIGKLSRLNLTAGEQPASATPGSQGSGKRTPRKSVPRLQYQMLERYTPGRSPAPIEPIRQRTSLLAAGILEQRCRWPINTPGAEDFCFCGNMPLGGLPYCAGHTRLAYRPGSRQRVMRG